MFSQNYSVEKEQANPQFKLSVSFLKIVNNLEKL